MGKYIKVLLMDATELRAIPLLLGGGVRGGGDKHGHNIFHNRI